MTPSQMAMGIVAVRTKVRAILAERYPFVIQPVRDALTTIAAQHGPHVNILQLAMKAMEVPTATASDRMMIMAAAADIIEERARA